MELLFLYLEKYKNLTRQAIDFSSRFIFSTILDGKVIRLNIKSNPNHIENFFENEYISNVTAIIGQNGTGKSNILEFIRTALPQGAGGFSEECMIAINDIDFRTGENAFKLFITPKINITLTDETSLFETIVLPPRDITPAFQTNYQLDLGPTTIFINYSNIVDLKIASRITKIKIESEEETTSVSGYRNISTMAMIADDQEGYSNDPRIKVEKLDAFKSREFGRNMDFITSQFRTLVDFRLPEYLYITLLEDDEANMRKELSDYEWVFDKVDKFNFEYTSIKDKKAKFYRRFIQALFYNLILTDLKASSIHFSKEYLYEAKGESFEAFFRDMLNHMMKLTWNDSSTPDLKAKAESVLSFLNHVYEYFIKTESPRILDGEENVLIIPVNFEGSFNVEQFINLYNQAKSFTDFLLFKWRSLSSGEQSWLTILSRFYRLSQQLKQDDQAKDLIILLDEPDIYFHPEWQRTLLYRLLHYLPAIFTNRRIQVIATANTPYMVSDLLPSNVIMLHKKGNAIKVHDAASIRKTTFASNIHTLLSEDFYVSSFIGEFAKFKIERLISFINNPVAYPFFTKENALKLINLIGEPVIKNRLQDLFDDKFPPDVNELTKRRARLQDELDELDNLMKDDSDND